MFITRLDIENFGPFHERALDGLSPGLTVLHGPNEAGKSALRAFIRSTFFGYMRRNERGYDFYSYPPLSGGVASGSVAVQMSSGARYSVHRREGPNRGPVKVTGSGPADTFASGQSGSELLESLLGRIGPELYQNLFSVSLSELQSLESLNAPQIRDRIYSVGLGLSQVSLPDALERLDDGIHRLRGPRSGRIREAEKRLIELRAQLEKARSDTGRYAAVVAQVQKVEHEAELAEARRDEARSRLQRQRQLIELRPHWERMQELERQLAEAPEIASFPAGGERALDEILARTHELEESSRAGDATQAARAAEHRAVPVVQAFVQYADPVRRLTSETEHYRKATEDLPVVEREQHDESTRLARDLEQLGPDWSEQRLIEFKWPADFYARMETAGKALAESQKSLFDAEAELRRRTDEHAQAAEAQQRAAAARDGVKDAPPEGVQDLEARGDKLRRLRAGMADTEVMEREQREVERKLAEGLARVQPEAVNAFIFSSIWTAVFIIALGLLAVGYGVWQKELAGVIPGGASLIAGAVLLVRARLTGKGMKIVLRRPKVGEANDVLKKQVEELKARVAAVQAEVKALAGELKLTGAPAVRTAEEELVKLGRALDRRRTFEALVNQFKDAEDRTKSAELQMAKATALHTEARAVHSAAQAAWQDVLQSGALRTGLEPSQAGQVVGWIQSARSQQKVVASLAGRVGKMRSTIEDIESRLAAVLQAAGLPTFHPGAATPALGDLTVRFSAHEKALEKARHIEREMAGWEKSRGELQQRLEQAGGELAALFQAAGVTSEQEFRAAAAQVERRAALVDSINDLRLSQPLLVNEVGKQYRQALEHRTPDELTANMQKIEEAVLGLDQSLKDLHTELGQLAEQRRAIEQSNRVSELHVEVSQVEERLKEDAREWAVMTVARDMLVATRDQFQRERQPALLLAASKYFHALTRGRYDRVEAVVGEDRFQVVSSGAAGSDGERKPVSGLSRGTAEQLYLSMRFALIEEYARNAEPLPVVMDDVLVNFDPDRARAACSTVLELSSQFQVLFMTCHPQTVEYFRDMAPQASGRHAPLAVVDLAGAAA
jgi:uncharacterized protein YhaN